MALTRAAEGGFEARFTVTRTDGKAPLPHKRFFILEYSGDDPFAVEAMRYYASISQARNPQLSKDLLAATYDPAVSPAQHDNAA